ncbi:MAG: FtsQ-type POTRA domain-containing protein [Candidatus Portnoybacteria bacterium]|nr:FtsQ-type POTRA domain-containing protein [Candidatus Portnoybacteria bacterium]
MWLSVTAVLVIVAGAVYALCFSPYLRIKEIKVEGAQKVSEEEIVSFSRQALADREQWIIPKDSLFFFAEQKFEDLLLKQIPLIKSVEVARNISGSLLIKVQERQKAIIYCDMRQCYNIDDSGLIFEEAPAVYGGMAIALKDNSGREIKIGDQAVGPELISFIKDVWHSLNERVNLNLIYFELSSYPAVEVDAITVEDWKIILDQNRSAVDQVAALKLVLDEKIKDQRDKLEYVDLRVGNRAYYKMK